MSAVEVLLLAVQFYVVSGKLTVLRGDEFDIRRQSNTRRLICVSDDDGAALTWNRNLSVTTYYEYIDNAFKNPNEPPETNFVDCKLDTLRDCTKSWTLSDWNLTHSIETHMGPVFDSRWEGFQDHKAADRSGYIKIRTMNSKEALPISVRGPKDAYILFCNGTRYEKNSCYWIIIGGWKNEMSAIRKCSKGMPQPPEYSSDANCNVLRANHSHVPLSPVEWKTFVVTWDQSTKNITVYDSEKRILTYEDTEAEPDAKDTSFTLFFWSVPATLIRFHTYNFLRTTVNNAKLVSPELSVTAGNFCVEMAVGLCADCRLYLSLIDTSTGTVRQKLGFVTGNASVHGLPTWQYARFNKTLSTKYSAVKLEMVSELEQKSQDPLWAVANVRSCPPAGSVRISTIFGESSIKDPYHWQNVSCERLFYKEHNILSTLDPVNADLDFDDPNCPNDKVGPYCSISCIDDLELKEHCKDAIICTEEGCACSRGIVGSRCDKTCDENHYGHNCRHTCGLCEGTCDIRTGKCSEGCDYSMGYKIPPLCQLGIDPLPPPTILFLDSTTIRVSIPLKEEYQMVKIAYSFQLEEKGNVDQNIHVDNQISNNGTNLTGNSGALHAGLSYRIRCNLWPKDFSTILGEWKDFTTPCNQSKSFEVESKNTSLTLNWEGLTTNFSCPSSWYNFTLKDSETGDKIYDESLKDLPHEFQDLKPYTSYQITIFREDKERIEYFSQEVKTLEAAPSEVRNIKSKANPNSVILSWDPPRTLNGVLRNYRVDLETVKYMGCNKRDKTPPTKNRTLFPREETIEVYDLPPYAEHVAKISACTLFCGHEEEHTFKTNEAENPTELYDDVQMDGFVLKWKRPEDCTTITGNLATRVIINGVSEAVANWTTTENIAHQISTLDLSKKLHGAEEYEAKIYVIRKKNSRHNQDAYRKKSFTTPAKAPPPVRDLEVYEINELNDDYPPCTQYNLRWKEPEPPLNGKLQHYIVKFAGGESIIKPTARCALWPHFICTMINMSIPQGQIRRYLKVSAVNENVTEESNAITPKTHDLENLPTVPEFHGVQALPQGVVLVNWTHPWLTGHRLRQFILSIERLSTNLRTSAQEASFQSIHRVDEYRIRYDHLLHLMPSSLYNIDIVAETIRGTKSFKISDRVKTSSAIEFASEPTVEVHNKTSTVLLQIPTILNDTTNSVINVVVKGSRICNDNENAARVLCKKARINCYDTAWWAATFPSHEFAGKQPFTVGGTKYRDDAINCSLHQRQSYVIAVSLDPTYENDEVIIAKELDVQVGEVSKGFDVAWLIPVLVSLIFIIAGLYLYRRKQKKLLKKVVEQDEMCLASNATSLEKEEKPHESDKIVTTTLVTPAEPSPTRLTSVYGDSVVLVTSGVSNQKENNSSSLVKVKDFEDYVKQAIESGLLDNQYNPLPRGQTKPWDYGKLPQNKPKNRYSNLIAYDENRVVLEKLPGDPYSDYINANYINGYKKENCYIATQGPKPITVNDFWRMIWQEESLIICMLTNVIESDKTKCEQYWPEIGKKKKYGDLVVFNAKHTVYADYTFRMLHLTKGQETRKIEHLHYTAWPDHGVPLSTHSVVTYMKKLLATSPGNGPAVIHCSAGVGRTGTIILCDICLRRAAAEGVVDVFAETVALRSQRANMVDTKQQYLLAHLTLLECLLSISTSLPCDQALPMKIEELKKGLVIQQKSLEKAIWQDEALRPAASEISLSERNLAKNRFPELASEKIGRVYLKRYPVTDEDSDYISAVYVDGVKMRNQYIATQLPLPETLGDFWRMVAEYKIELIVSLQPPDPEDPTCCSLVPSSDFTPVPYINIKTKKTIASNYYSMQKLTLVDDTLTPAAEQEVTIVTSTEWKAGRYQDPPSTIALTTMWQATETIARGNGPTAILCHDATTGCGLYLALSILLERMAVERECDVCLAIRSVRRSNHGFVQSLKQMEYLYDAAITFLRYFETYANFT
ncbi:uncharacterized protein LOC144467943 [Augochlora pura]